MVAETRQNLADFCREHGVAIIAPAVATPSTSTTGLAGATRDTVRRPNVPDPERASVPAETDALPLPPAARTSPRLLLWVAIGAMVLTVAAVFSNRETPAVAPLTRPTEPAPSPLPALPEAERTEPVIVAPTAGDRNALPATPVRPAPSPGAVSLTTAELCETFSTDGGRWRCDPAGDSVAPGAIVFYTRVRSARDAAIVHRWYREDTLRRAATLTIGASPSEGYRTYSRQTVDAGNWRLEVTTADGALLHEQRFIVR